MTSVYSQRRQNIAKTWLLMTVFLGLVIGLAFIFGQIFKSPAILYFGIGFALFMNLLSYWFSDKLVIALTGARAMSKDEFPEVVRIVENLTITAGLKTMPKLYILDQAAINAFATGRNPDKAVIAVTVGAIRKLNDKELEGVLAHELSHIQNLDMKVMAVATILAGVVAILADLFLRSALWGGISSNEREGNRGNAIVFIIGIAIAILAPLFAQLIQLAVSRKREFLADASAVMLTRYPDGLIKALLKISQDTEAFQTEPATAHLFIANPFREGETGEQRERNFLTWLGNLFATHPPIAERIKALQSLSS